MVRSDRNRTPLRIVLVHKKNENYASGANMRMKTSKKPNLGTCGEGKYCVQLYSRRASLVSEFCLDMQENNLLDLEAAEQLLRQTLSPCDFAATTVTLISDEGANDQTIVQFDTNQV